MRYRTVAVIILLMGATVGAAQTLPGWVTISPEGLLEAPQITPGARHIMACEAHLKGLATALETCSIDHQGRYPERLDELVPGYLPALPICPAAGADTYSDGYRSAVQPDRFTLACRGSHHQSVGLGDNEPRYDSERGLLSDWDRPGLRRHYILLGPNGQREVDWDEARAFEEGTEDGRLLVMDAQGHLSSELIRLRQGNTVRLTVDGQTRTMSEREFMSYQEERKLEVCRGNLERIRAALEMYRAWEGSYPRSLSELTPHYLMAIPTCPSAEGDTYSDGYAPGLEEYAISCSWGHHSDPDLRHFPRP